jgi:O-antigen/teichoic acid export membrane protein
VLGRIPETVIAPLLFIVLVLVVSQTAGLSATGATALQVGGLSVAFVLGAWLLRRAMPYEVTRAVPQYETRAWLNTALPFLVMAGVSMLTTQVGTIVVGLLQGSEAAGMYNVATRAAVFTSFLWLTATYPLGPMIPRLYVTDEHDELERVLTRFGRLTFLATLPLALGLVVFAHPVLSIFGEEFTGGEDAMRLIALGELAKVAAGFASVALLMTAYERGATVVLAASCVLTIALDLVLVPLWGIEGAAVGSTAGAVLASVFAVSLARKHLGMRLSALRLTSAGPRRPAEPGGGS